MFLGRARLLSITAYRSTLRPVRLAHSESSMVQSYPVFYFDEVDSTMDKAKEIINSSDASTPTRFAVIADAQTSGRGTRGRSWTSPKSNLYLTLAFKLSDVKIPMTLIPLRIGCIVREQLQKLVDPDVRIRLKWPNDILINGGKVCGILTEMERDSVVVGIGCNVSYVPSIDEVGPDAGRVATSLSSFRHSLPALQEDAARDLGRMIAHAVNYEYLDGPGDSGEHVTADFTEQLDRAPQRLRANGSQGREVLPCGVNADGSLRVIYTDDNSSGSLYADYLW